MAITIHNRRYVSEFFAELSRGLLCGIGPRPARAIDVHAMFVDWARARGVVAAAAPAVIVNALATRHGLHVARKRYAIGYEIAGPHSIIYLTQPEPPPVGWEADWLGMHVGIFAADVARYRDHTRWLAARENAR